MLRRISLYTIEILVSNLRCIEIYPVETMACLVQLLKKKKKCVTRIYEGFRSLRKDLIFSKKQIRAFFEKLSLKLCKLILYTHIAFSYFRGA